MQNKHILTHAIESYDIYSIRQRKTLSLLINTSVNGLSEVSAEYISKTTGISKANIYQNIKKLEKDKIITRIRKEGAKIDSFQLNSEKLDYILQLYQIKKAMEND
jgi:biotin operon repressor